MLDFFLSYLLVYTYPVLFFVTLISSFIFPIGSSTLLMAAWAFVAQWYLDPVYVLIFSYLGCLIGDTSGYLLSFFYGKKLLRRIGFAKIIQSTQFTWLEKFFTNNAKKSIFLSRFVLTGLGSSINILSWFAKIGYKKYLLARFSGGEK